jgi:hypothetical protein
MRANGLAIESETEPIQLSKVNATDDPGTIGPVDMVLFSVKLWTPRARRVHCCRSWDRRPASSRSRTACRRMTRCAVPSDQPGNGLEWDAAAVEHYRVR